MMLHHRNNHFIAFFHLTIGKGSRHKIYALCGATGKHNLGCAACVDETSYRFARSFMKISSLLRQEMYTTMHIGIYRIILVSNRLYHTTRLLGCSPIVEINQRLIIHRTRQYRKVFSNFLYIVHNKRVYLFTDGTSLAFVQLATETLFYQQMQAVFQGFHTDIVYHLVYERKHQ